MEKGYVILKASRKVTEGWIYFFRIPDDQLFQPPREVEWNVARVMDDTTRLRRASGSKKVGLDDKTAESPYDLSMSEQAVERCHSLAVDPAIYLFNWAVMSTVGKPA